MTDQAAAESSVPLEVELWVDFVSAVCREAKGRLETAISAFERPHDVTVHVRSIGVTAGTFDAHRMLMLALEQGGTALQSAVLERLLAASQDEGMALDDPAVVQRLAAEAGLDEQRVAAVLAGADLSDRVGAEADRARDQDIADAPHVVVNERVHLAGLVAVEDYLEALRAVAAGRS